jgi:hypothetical protein
LKSKVFKFEKRKKKTKLHAGQASFEVFVGACTILLLGEYTLNLPRSQTIVITCSLDDKGGTQKRTTS